MRDTPPRFEVNRLDVLRASVRIWPYRYHFSTSQNKDRPCGLVSRRTRRKPRGTRVESGGAPPRCGRKNATREAHIGCCRVPSCATGRTAERGHAIAFRAVAGCVACCRLAFGAHLAGNSCWPLGLNCLGIYTGNLYASVVRHPLVHPVTFLSIRGVAHNGKGRGNRFEEKNKEPP